LFALLKIPLRFIVSSLRFYGFSIGFLIDVASFPDLFSRFFSDLGMMKVYDHMVISRSPPPLYPVLSPRRKSLWASAVVAPSFVNQVISLL